jgi:hypothetical protein
MRLAFYKAPGTWWDRCIRVVTKSHYSHVELVDDIACWSSSVRDGGVRLKYIDFNQLDTWDFVLLPTTVDRNAALAWFVSHKGQSYDWLGVIRFIIPFIPQSETKWFCSEAVAASLGLDSPESFSPQGLYDKFKSMGAV